MTRLTILIIGGGQAGGQLTKALSEPERGFAGEIVLVGDEPHAPYERPPLSKAALKDAGCEHEVFTISPEVFDRPNVTHVTGDAVVQVDPATSVATLASGRRIAFSKAVFATGGRAVRLPIEGADLCHDLRTLDDARALRKTLTPSARLVILGGGVIGMEVAATAQELGATVTVVEAGDRIMARCLSPSASAWLETRHREMNTQILTQRRALAVRSTGTGYEVTLSDGTSLSADQVLSAVGIAPNAALAPAGSIGASGGIVTDGEGRLTGFPNLYALGDVSEVYNAHAGCTLRLETWRNADNHARALARTLAGEPTPHIEIPWMWTDQFGDNIQVVGLYGPGIRETIRGETGKPGAAILWTRDGILTGGVLINNGRDRRFLEQLAERRARIDMDMLCDPSIPLKTLAKGAVAA